MVSGKAEGNKTCGFVDRATKVDCGRRGDPHCVHQRALLTCGSQHGTDTAVDPAAKGGNDVVHRQHDKNGGKNR
ncbi:Uncharacterised protein [Shigella sonnei]|nr:Uncharacterised protein [Shigella sonnei]